MINPEKILKKITLSIISPLFNSKSKTIQIEDWKNFKKVLVFRLDNKLGNAILLLPLIQSIKNSVPDIKIDVLYSSVYSQIFENHPAIHSYIEYDQKYLLKNPIRYLKLISQIRKCNYDVVFSSTNSNSFSVSQALFAGLLKAKYTVGFDWKESAKLYRVAIKGNTGIHYSQAQVDLWKFFDTNAVYENPKIYFTQGNSIIASEKKVLFWIGATGNKILPNKLLMDILAILDNNNISFQMAAGPHDEGLLSRYPAIKSSEIDFLKGSLNNTARFFKRFKIIIIPDTGPAHLSVALGIPTVQVFVNSDPVWYAYRGEHLFLINNKINESDFLHFAKNHLE